LFQSIYQPADSFMSCVALMPEWYMLSAIVGMLATLGFFWAPLLWAWALFVVSLLIIITQSALSAFTNISSQHVHQRKMKYKLLITFLHMLQPLARLCGRLKHGLTPWRKKKPLSKLRYNFALGSKTFTYWSEQWRPVEDWLEDIEHNLIDLKARFKRGGDFDRWDVQVTNSLFSVSRGLVTIEEHGSGKQLLRFKVWSRASKAVAGAIVILLTIATFAALDKAWIMAFFLAMIAVVFATEYILDAANNINDLFKAFQSLNKEVEIVNAEGVEEMEEEQYEEELPYIQPALLSVKFTFQSSDAEISPNIERLAAKRVFMDNAIKTINE